MSDPTKPPPNPPGPWDHEDPPSDIRPKAPKRPTPTPRPTNDGDPKDITLGWADEPAAPGDYAEIIRRARNTPSTIIHTMTVEASADWRGILSTTRDGDPIPAELDDAKTWPASRQSETPYRKLSAGEE